MPLPYDVRMIPLADRAIGPQSIEDWTGGAWLPLTPEDFGAKGDGVTDDTAAIAAAEVARQPGQTLRFAPGRTYIVGTGYTNTVAGRQQWLFAISKAGFWDLQGATLQWGGAAGQPVTTGSDGGGLGIINALAAPFCILGFGTIDGASLVRSPLAFQGDLSGFTVFVTLQNLRETTLSVWDGTQGTVSVDVSGVALSANRAKNLSGIIRRPACPTTQDEVNISNHIDVTAYLLGGNDISSNSTSTALVRGLGAAGAAVAGHILLGLVGIPEFVPNNGADNAMVDLSVSDLNHQVAECQGGKQLGQFALGGTSSPGHIIKNNAVTGHYHYNATSGAGTPPNARRQGGASAQHASDYVAGQFQLGNVTPADGANLTIDLSLGNRFYCAVAAGRTVSAPTNPPVNPAGLLLTQRFTITIKNTTGGAIVTTFSAAYHLAGAWVDPAAGKQRSITFEYDVTAGVAYEISRTAADVTP